MAPKVTLLIPLLLSSFISGTLSVYGETRSLQEYEVKAAFLFNFAKFVEWPANAFTSADEPIILGILGADPFGDSLKPLEEKTAGGRRLVIKRFVSAEALEKCHILFVSRSSAKDFPQILPTTRNWNVLTVGEVRGFTEAGGIINFVLVDKKIRFEINVDAAQQAGLKISSQLLKVAKIVRADT